MVGVSAEVCGCRETLKYGPGNLKRTQSLRIREKRIFRIPTNYIWLQLLIKSLIAISLDFVGIWTSFHQKSNIKIHSQKPKNLSIKKHYNSRKQSINLCYHLAFEFTSNNKSQLIKKKFLVKIPESETLAVHIKKCTL